MSYHGTIETTANILRPWLSEKDAYTLHKPVRRHFKRRCVVVGGSNQQWQADLVDMSRLKKSNDGTTFLLTVIDVFSKRAWCIPLKNKSAASLVAAFTQLLRERSPITLQTDKGSEFLNRSLQKLLKQYGVHHFSTHNKETKASIVERFNMTLKTRMWRYFTKSQSVRYLDVLQDFVRSYNKTYHRSDDDDDDDDDNFIAIYMYITRHTCNGMRFAPELLHSMLPTIQSSHPYST